MMLKVQQEQIKEKLEAIAFSKIVRRTGFDTKYKKKLSAFAFLFGFMKMYSNRCYSLSHWASCVGGFIDEQVSASD